MPAAFAAGANASISSATNAAKACGDPTFGTKSNFFIATCTPGVITVALISALSRFTTSLGVPAGAQKSRPAAPRQLRETGLSHRRHIREVRVSRLARNRESMELSFLNEGEKIRDRAEIHIHPAAKQIGHCLRAALVGNQSHVDSGRDLEHLSEDVRPAGKRDAPVQFAWIGLGVGNQVLHRLRRYSG